MQSAYSLSILHSVFPDDLSVFPLSTSFESRLLLVSAFSFFQIFPDSSFSAAPVSVFITHILVLILSCLFHALGRVCVCFSFHFPPGTRFPLSWERKLESFTAAAAASSPLSQPFPTGESLVKVKLSITDALTALFPTAGCVRGAFLSLGRC